MNKAQRKIKKTKLFVLFLIATVGIFQTAHAEFKNNFHDMYPLFSTEYPYVFLNQESKNKLNDEKIRGIHERLQLVTSMAAHTATMGRDKDKNKVQLGNIHGNLGMLPLLYGTVPTGQTQTPLLTTASSVKFPTFTNPLTGLSTTPSISDATYTDPLRQFGYFQAPLKYNKIAARFCAAVRI